MMPELSGYDVCKEIRKQNPLTGILFISAKSEEIDTVLGLELGALLIDVREPDEVSQGSPAQARRIVRGFLELRVEDAAPDPDTELLLLCAGGVRSLFAKHMMGLAGRLPRLSRGVPLR